MSEFITVVILANLIMLAALFLLRHVIAIRAPVLIAAVGISIFYCLLYPALSARVFYPQVIYLYIMMIIVGAATLYFVESKFFAAKDIAEEEVPGLTVDEALAAMEAGGTVKGAGLQFSWTAVKARVSLFRSADSGAEEEPVSASANDMEPVQEKGGEWAPEISVNSSTREDIGADFAEPGEITGIELEGLIACTEETVEETSVAAEYGDVCGEKSEAAIAGEEEILLPEQSFIEMEDGEIVFAEVYAACLPDIEPPAISGDNALEIIEEDHAGNIPGYMGADEAEDLTEVEHLIAAAGAEVENMPAEPVDMDILMEEMEIISGADNPLSDSIQELHGDMVAEMPWVPDAGEYEQIIPETVVSLPGVEDGSLLTVEGGEINSFVTAAFDKLVSGDSAGAVSNFFKALQMGPPPKLAVLLGTRISSIYLSQGQKRQALAVMEMLEVVWGPVLDESDVEEIKAIIIQIKERS